MEENIRKLTVVMTALLSRIEALEAQVKDLEVKLTDAKRRDEITKEKTHKRTFSTWRQILQLKESGMAAKNIATMLKIPYSTVTSYIRTPESEANKWPVDNEAEVKPVEGFKSKLEQAYTTDWGVKPDEKGA